MYRPIWSAPDSKATVRRLSPMWIITSVLWRSKGLVREIRNRNNSRTQGKPYGSKGPEPTYTFGYFKKIISKYSESYFNTLIRYVFTLFKSKKRFNICALILCLHHTVPKYTNQMHYMHVESLYMFHGHNLNSICNFSFPFNFFLSLSLTFSHFFFLMWVYTVVMQYQINLLHAEQTRP